MPSSSSSVETDSPPEARREVGPPKLSLSAPKAKNYDSQDTRARASSLGRSKALSESEDTTEKRKMDTLNVSPQLHHYGIPLGTPAAREAARSFWTMDQLRVSLDKIAQYTSEQTDSLSSLGSSIDSGSIAFTNSGLSTPSQSQPSLSLTPSQPQITMSAPTTPLSSPRVLTSNETPSPLLLATRLQGDTVATLPSSLPSSPRLPGHSHRGKLRTHPDLSPGVSKRMTSSSSRISSAPVKRHELKPALSVEGKQITLTSRNSSSPTFSISTPPPDTPLRSASYGGTISPDDGFHE